MALSDTSPDIEAMQIRIRRAMTPEQRLRVAFELSDLMREFRKAGIRRDHPDWSDLKVKHELIRQAFVHEPVPEWLEKKMREREEEERASK